MILNLIISGILMFAAGRFVLSPFDGQKRKEEQYICFIVLMIMIPYIVFTVGS